MNLASILTVTRPFLRDIHHGQMQHLADCFRIFEIGGKIRSTVFSRFRYFRVFPAPFLVRAV